MPPGTSGVSLVPWPCCQSWDCSFRGGQGSGLRRLHDFKIACMTFSPVCFEFFLLPLVAFWEPKRLPKGAQNRPQEHQKRFQEGSRDPSRKGLRKKSIFFVVLRAPVTLKIEPPPTRELNFHFFSLPPFWTQNGPKNGAKMEPKWPQMEPKRLHEGVPKGSEKSGRKKCRKWSILGLPGGPLGQPFGEHFGENLGRICGTPFREAFGTILGPFWNHFWDDFGTCWGHFLDRFLTIEAVFS